MRVDIGLARHNSFMHPSLTHTFLITDSGGIARFKDEPMLLSEGTVAAHLSPLQRSGGFQFRMSPIGFRSLFHCTTTPQWLIVCSGAMEIGLQDGSARVFTAGQGFYANDTLPVGSKFDPTRHGHCSRQLGDLPLVTMFVRTQAP
jgi:hypothetical protein